MTQSRARSIAIVGIGCRFPGGVDSHESFLAMLREGRDAVGDIPADRIDLQRFYNPSPRTPGKIMTRRGGYLSNIDQFDAEFFSLSPREAERMDPQQRLALETAWEAFEDAGIDPLSLKGEKVGVFLGQWVSDFEQRLSQHPGEFDFQMTLGSGRYGLSGRVSYLYGFMGPSMTVDTACSSSLVTVHLASRSLRSGETDIAIAGGVNVILGPHIHLAYSQAGMMATDGRCKFGDARADGYVRSEGAGVVALKRLEDALRDGDRIHAVIRGSAVNNDGASSGSMGRPSVEGQRAAIQAAVADAEVEPLQISYVEAHGTGTQAGDRVEIEALGRVLGQDRPASAPLRLGSVKTNIGHTESAAGIAGLIKAALTVREGVIPASLHFETPSPLVNWDAAPVRIARTAEGWAGPAATRVAGVNSFGISGTNAHVILEGPPERSPAAHVQAIPLLPLSARSEAALRALAGRVADRLAARGGEGLADIIRFAQGRRAALEHRAAFHASDANALIAELRAYADGGDAMAAGVAERGKPAKVSLVFPGQGGQWSGMARALMARAPAFRESLERADAAIRREAGWSLLEQLALDPGDPGYLGERIDVIQPTLGALSIAYADWMKSAGLLMDAVVGHSMGEAAAAYVAGALSLDEALRVLCRRSILMHEKSGEGAMALVDLPAEDVARDLVGLQDKVAIGAINSARSTVISGAKAAVAECVAAYDARGVFSRLVKVDVASHSPQMEGPARALRAELADIAPTAAAIPFASALRGAMVPGEMLDADYWARNLREPVQFAKALDALAELGVSLFLELGPHPVLAPSIEQATGGQGATVVCCGRRDEDEMAGLTAALATLWCAGAKVDFAGGAKGPVVDFPTYPWTRRRHWVGTAEIARTSGDSPARSAPNADAYGLLFGTVWRELPTAATAATAATGARSRGRWLLVGADNQLASELESLGAEVEHAPLAELETRLGALTPGTTTQVLLAAPSGEAAAFLPLRGSQAMPDGVDARLWFLTRDAQAPTGVQRTNVDHAALWGAARVLGDERPEVCGGVLDLAVGATAQDARIAAAWLLHQEDESFAAVREGRILAPRLTPMTEAHGKRLGWRSDGAYLLTGGLGDIGLSVARAMVEEGARRLVLMSRGGLPPRRTWADVDPHSPTGRRIAAVRALEALGASIHCPAADVADEAAVAAFLTDYAAEGWPPIRAVIHLAGILDRRLIGETSQAEFEVAAAGKLRGARVLDRLLPDLDLFVLFSSMTTVLPQSGIAAYVAANAGLEALAVDRRARGLPAVAIAWGQWRVGMLADASGEATLAEQAAQGVGAFSAERGSELFSWVAAQAAPVIAVAPIDWETYGKARTGLAEPLLKELVRATDAPSKARPETVEEMATLVRESLARTIQLPADQIDPGREFGAMGLTSLLALELRNRLERALGRPLSATLAWNYPTTTALAAHLTDAGKAPAQPPAPVQPSGKLAAKAAAVAELSDADALLALRSRRKGAS